MKKRNKTKYSTLKCLGFEFGVAWQYQKLVFGMAVLTAIAQVVQNLASLLIAPRILEKVERSAALPELIRTIVLYSCFLFAASAIATHLKGNWGVNRIYVRQKIVDKILHKCAVTSFSNLGKSDYRACMEGAFGAVGSNSAGSERIWLSLSDLLKNLLGFGIWLTLVKNLNGLLIAVVLFTTVVSFFFSRWIGQWEYRHREEKHKLYEKMNYTRKQAESAEVAKDIRIFGLDSWIREIYGKAVKTYEDFLLKREKNNIWKDLLDLLFSVLRNGIAYGYLIRMTLQRDMSASEFLLYFTAVSSFTEWITGILASCTEINQACMDLRDVMTFLDYPEEFRFSGGAEIPQADKYELRLDHVTFCYPGAEKPIFTDLNLTIHPGEKLAIVGANGAGKTTLVRLLCGMFDPSEGRVLLNGQDIRQYNRQEYYKLMSAVFQDYSLLDAELRYNVTQSFERDRDESALEALDKAGLSDFLDSLPCELSTHVGRDVYLDGVLFSGGQTQRLMLARALYKNGPILVLDEPTAALDPIAESNIYQKYHEMTTGKTSVFISHRLASTRFCDRILFLKDGRIAEEGTHEELLAKKGEYAALFEVQSRYYQEGGNEDGE